MQIFAGGDMNRVIFMMLSTIVISCALSGRAVAAQSGELINGKFNVASRNVRSEVARDLVGKIQRLYDLIPNPTPSELDWVKQEGIAIEKLDDMSEAKTPRRVRYSESPEFQHVKTHALLANILQLLSCAAAPSTPLRKEIFCWSSASLLLTDLEFFNYAIYILIKSGRLPNTIDGHNVIGSKDLGYGFWLNTYGRGIHQFIVNPYLNGQIK